VKVGVNALSVAAVDTIHVLIIAVELAWTENQVRISAFPLCSTSLRSYLLFIVNKNGLANNMVS
jgi:hypothetical protein